MCLLELMGYGLIHTFSWRKAKQAALGANTAAAIQVNY